MSIQSIIPIIEQAFVDTPGQGNASLLIPGDPPPFTIKNPAPKIPLVVVDSHSSARFPRNMKPHGISADELKSLQGRHVAFDLHCTELTTLLMEILAERGLSAAGIQGNYSRLVMECNRSIADCLTTEGEYDDEIFAFNMPPSDPEERARWEWEVGRRFREIYLPYQQALEKLIEDVIKIHDSCLIWDIHSLTFVYNNKARDRAQVFNILHFDDPLHQKAANQFAAFLEEQGEGCIINHPYNILGRRNDSMSYGDAHGVARISLDFLNNKIKTPEERYHVATVMADFIQQEWEDHKMYVASSGRSHESLFARGEPYTHPDRERLRRYAQLAGTPGRFRRKSH